MIPPLTPNLNTDPLTAPATPRGEVVTTATAFAATDDIQSHTIYRNAKAEMYNIWGGALRATDIIFLKEDSSGRSQSFNGTAMCLEKLSSDLIKKFPDSVSRPSNIKALLEDLKVLIGSCKKLAAMNSAQLMEVHETASKVSSGVRRGLDAMGRQSQSLQNEATNAILAYLGQPELKNPFSSDTRHNNRYIYES